MSKVRKPVSNELPASTNLRIRAIWPTEHRDANRPPIWGATRDCILRLLNSSVTSTYAAGQIAHRLAAKVEAAHAEYVRTRVDPIAAEEKALGLLMPEVLQGKTTPKQEELLAPWNVAHKKAVEVALDGSAITLTAPELQLLREAIAVCGDKTQYRDPAMAFGPELFRWYAPILGVLMGATTDTDTPPAALPASKLEELRAKLAEQ